MKQQKSFTRVEQNVRHSFRNNLNIADSIEDVKKFFIYAVQDFIDQAFEGRVLVDYADVELDPGADNGFRFSSALRGNKEFSTAYGNSDIPQIIARMAENALHHVKHLEEKHPDKSEAKMYPTPSHSGRFFRNPPRGREPR